MKKEPANYREFLNFEKIKSFYIKDLFGYKNVKISLEREALILVGENGSGKTTILEIIYNLLCFNFSELTHIKFKSIIVNLISGEFIEISKKDMKTFSYNKELQEEAKKSILYFPARRIIKKEAIDFTSKGLDFYFKKFSETCNEYLCDKKIIYSEATEKALIIETKNNTSIDVDVLSFAEKKIILIFFEIYFKKCEKFIILFDEPESSLMMKWQRRLFLDVFKSTKCKFLLAMTHSPFIFDNELDENAHDLDALNEARG